MRKASAPKQTEGAARGERPARAETHGEAVERAVGRRKDRGEPAVDGSATSAIEAVEMEIAIGMTMTTAGATDSTVPLPEGDPGLARSGREMAAIDLTMAKLHVTVIALVLVTVIMAETVIVTVTVIVITATATATAIATVAVGLLARIVTETTMIQENAQETVTEIAQEIVTGKSIDARERAGDFIQHRARTDMNPT